MCELATTPGPSQCSSVKWREISATNVCYVNIYQDFNFHKYVIHKQNKYKHIRPNLL